ncbi:hypothetical protein CKM354_000542600 [Cercospora kikuchii]|uniref:Uncharacterized protein n=1 Tax=Cercospora kikuchii TaxID=84275 RepID=A0A9P3CFA8_9PEZI|nr:uncharacterized protein CKM354_000542600 [Cercospora kikuchii]GIZ42147.1 hypothetical protein CKM354_000542600 [Cercospora kikuchii]
MAATTPTALPEVLSEFEAASNAALNGLPAADAILPPEDGITLFDTKNEIFLAYLQALALRNLNVIRSVKAGSDVHKAQSLSDEITKKLIEQRVYLERGVGPLEKKLKYEVDRVVKVADEEERNVTQKLQQAVKANGHAREKEGGSVSGESGSDSDSDSDGELAGDVDAYVRPDSSKLFGGKELQSTDTVSAAREKSASDGVYRPPRISATAMPTTERREKKERGPGRSATLDEYVSTELSAAPLAQPSIGSNLAAGGRTSKNARQMKEEAERRDYEETHLTRLPAMSKKERAKKGLGRARDGGFGGEEWSNIGASLDRIGDLTKRKGKDSALDKSRKRRAVEDGPRGDGIGASFDTKKRRLAKKGRI